MVRARLDARDKAMVREYLSRQDLARQDLRFALEPGDLVLVKQRIPGKLRAKAEGPYEFKEYTGVNHLGARIVD